MKYKTHSAPQGSEEWLQTRDGFNNASELSIAAGINPYRSRDKLIHEIATGVREEIDSYQQKIFNNGHRAEALARPLAEAVIGEDLFPEVCSVSVPGLARRLGASFDGKKMDDSGNWEHKTLGGDLLSSLDSGVIPEFHRYQMEQGMLLNGANRCLFTASKWAEAPGDETEDGKIYGIAPNDDGIPTRYALVDIRHVWYESDPEIRTKIIPIWQQFESDLANYKPVEVIPAAVAAPTEGFGALVLQVEGRVVACNIDAFRAGASAFLNRLPKPEELNSDQDFANAESAVKACSEAEAKIKAAKDAGLAQMSEVDTVLRVADQIVAEIKAARLALEKSVEIRKASIRSEIVQSGKDRLAEHLGTLNKRLGRVQMPAINADFLAAIKGKRTVESLRNAVDTVLANAKIAANDIADKIQINLATLDENKEHAFLFNDVASLVMKAPDDLANVIKLRIAEHAAEQARKLEAERERIRKEEQARIAAEELRRMDAERKEQERIAAESAKQNTPPPVARSPESENAPDLVRQAVSLPVTEAVTVPSSDVAKRIDWIIAQMTGAEQKLVLHYCERLIEQRKEAA